VPEEDDDAELAEDDPDESPPGFEDEESDEPDEADESDEEDESLPDFDEDDDAALDAPLLRLSVR
jgi:hypothetical protein